MKKQDMIKQIQLTEANMFLKCKQDEYTFGSDSPVYKTSRSKWNSVHELMTELGIEPDYSLDAHNGVMDLIDRKYSEMGAVGI